MADCGCICTSVHVQLNLDRGSDRVYKLQEGSATDKMGELGPVWLLDVLAGLDHLGLCDVLGGSQPISAVHKYQRINISQHLFYTELRWHTYQLRLQMRGTFNYDVISIPILFILIVNAVGRRKMCSWTSFS